MTNHTTLEALLARVLEGEGPDRELDARIYILLTGGSEADADYAATDPEVTCKPPRYTASLDAALTLVPDGWGWARTPQGDKVLVAVFIDIPLPDGSWRSEWIGEIHADDKRAFIAACLKARMEAQLSSDT